ncbi:MAG: large conductance mechanosensitive channel protein MscL [Anaerolineae bacterium]|nr:large conductance mechanosensitive channel protein MscL [Anaerolineae bacterium]
MLKGFKEFVQRGNVIDMAVGIIIGAAFTTVVQSLVKDIVMPPIGRLTGGINFADLLISLDGNKYASLADAQEAGAATINYGLFINNLISFLIVAFAVYLIIRAYQKTIVKEEPAGAPTTKKCPECLSDIPIEARRCAHCTVLLEPTPSAPGELS